MCGLTGFLLPRSRLEAADLQSFARTMTGQLTHRGPDDQGVWVDASSGIALGHARLAIIDLSTAGHQPMHSACGRYVMVFNGEIYNHRALRSRLERDSAFGRGWAGDSDTEVLLAAIATWGVQSALEAAVGMFAIALWDCQRETLTLARDRFGEKPLYYGFANGGHGPLLFGSELKALMAHPDWQGTLDGDVLEGYLRFGCVGGMASIFQGVAKLPPASLLTVSVADVQGGQLPAPIIWWSAEQAARDAMADPIMDHRAAIAAVEQALSQSVRDRMLADVPLGAFLSGGVDSSLVVALMQQQSDRPVRTFSVGFDDHRYDESGHAEAVAKHFGTEHLTLQATSAMALDLVPGLADLYDEPFADSSQLPSVLISKLTREHVTVALSGDGGDELFGGYNRHLWVPRIWRKLKPLPLPMRRALGRVLKSVSVDVYDRLMQSTGRLLPRRLQMRTFGEKLHKLAAVLESSDQQALFAGVASMNREPTSMLQGKRQGKSPDALFSVLHGFNSVEWMLLMDTLHYLVDDVLVKVDGASMASSLEVRVPFLDPQVFHAAWRIPVQTRLHHGQGKWVLRQLLYKYVPQELIDRPKMGFAVPLDVWLRGPLRDWAEELLAPASLKQMPLVDAHQVQQLWQRHLKGPGHHAQQLWAVLQLLAWQRRWRPRLN